MFILTLAIDLWNLICVREANGKQYLPWRFAQAINMTLELFAAG